MKGLPQFGCGGLYLLYLGVKTLKGLTYCRARRNACCGPFLCYCVAQRGNGDPQNSAMTAADGDTGNIRVNGPLAGDAGPKGCSRELLPNRSSAR
jgi:hypothetical protein